MLSNSFAGINIKQLYCHSVGLKPCFPSLFRGSVCVHWRSGDRLRRSLKVRYDISFNLLKQSDNNVYHVIMHPISLHFAHIMYLWVSNDQQNKWWIFFKSAACSLWGRNWMYQFTTLRTCWGSEVAVLKTLYYLEQHIVACRAVAMQRPRGGRIYQGRFWATGL
jgi:hypothetical protein